MIVKFSIFFFFQRLFRIISTANKFRPKQELLAEYLKSQKEKMIQEILEEIIENALDIQPQRPLKKNLIAFFGETPVNPSFGGFFLFFLFFSFLFFFFLINSK